TLPAMSPTSDVVLNDWRTQPSRTIPADADTCAGTRTDRRANQMKIKIRGYGGLRCYLNATPVIFSPADSTRSWNAASSASRWAACGTPRLKYRAVTCTSLSVPVARRTGVLAPLDTTTGALEPPIRVRTHPGSTAFDSVSGRRVATANASAVTASFESEYACV